MVDDFITARRHIPFADHGRDKAGLDCWGLVRLIYHEDLGIELPSMDTAYRDARDARAIEPAIGRESINWVEVEPGGERRYDVAHMREGGRPMHVGLIVRPGLILHTTRGPGTHLARYPDPRWPAMIVGIFRHPGMANSDA